MWRVRGACRGREQGGRVTIKLSLALMMMLLGNPALLAAEPDLPIDQVLASRLIAAAVADRVGHKVNMGTDLNRPAGGLSKSTKRIIGLLGGASSLLIANRLYPKLAVRDDLSAVAAAESADERFALLSLHSGALGLWDLHKGSEIARLSGPIGGATAVAVRSDGRLFLHGAAGGSVTVADLAQSFPLRPGGGAAVAALALDADGTRGAIAASDGTVEIWDVAARRVAGSTKLSARPVSVGFESGASSALIILAADGSCYRWHGDAAPASRLPPGHTDIAAARLDGAADTATLIHGARTVMSLDVVTGRTRRLFEASEPLRAVLPVSADAVLAIDQTGNVKLLSTADGHKLGQLVTTARGWAVLDNAGRFDGSTRGMAAISWKQGDQSFDLQQFATDYFEPAILSRLIAGGDGAKSAPASPAEGMRAPPSVKVVVPSGETRAANKPFPVVVVAEDGGGGIQDLRLFHNGKVVDAGSMVQTRDYDDGTHRLRVAVFKVVPKAGLNTFRASATSEKNLLAWSARSGASFAGEEVKGTLRILAVGINSYSNGVPPLNLAVADAVGVVDTFKAPSTLFGNAVGMTLLDDAAGKSAILNAIASIGEASRPEDTVVVYLAGHGVALSAEEWLFAPYGTDIRNQDALRATTVSASELQAALVKINARRIVLAIDACQSATAFGPFLRQRSLYMRLLSDISRSTGIVVYAATQQQEEAHELESLKHGVFTYALMKGLSGEALGEGAEAVTAFGVADYLENTVPVLAQQFKIGEQDTATFELGADFPLH